MGILSALSFILGTCLTPFLLLLTSSGIAASIGFRRLIRPKRFLGLLTERPEDAETSPMTALSVALAGTLGVGNITGVASALFVGGAGAVFWMWVGAVLVLPVKYAEVWLAVHWRRRGRNGWYGGAMYYIRDGLGKLIKPQTAWILGGIFASLCCLHSLVTGNIVQSNAAVCVFPEDSRLLCGILLGLLVFVSVLFGTKKIERITASVIPSLTVFYIAACLMAILPRAVLIPGILKTIVFSAFCPRSVLGAAAGFSVREAMRFGIMRGIFSNEAGCGTSPTAHAAADTVSPSHQACFGVIEVVFDTLILCTLTALTLLVADEQFGILPWHIESDAAPVTLTAFRLLDGRIVAELVRISVVLFAYSSIIAQFYYGMTAIGYLTGKRIARLVFSAVSAVCPVIGAVIEPGVMWLLADVLLGLMTAMNCLVLLALRNTVRSAGSPRSPRRTSAPR